MSKKATIAGATVSAATEAIEEQPSYVVHGAEIECSCGLRKSNIVVKEGHGALIHGMPQLHVGDRKPNENILTFGGCTSPENQSVQEAANEIIDEVKNRKKGFMDRIMDFLCRKEEAQKTDEFVGKCAGACTPIFSIDWLGGKEDVLIKDGEEDKEALLSTCTLSCLYGGQITITDDGQEQAINALAALQEEDSLGEDAEEIDSNSTLQDNTIANNIKSRLNEVGEFIQDASADFLLGTAIAVDNNLFLGSAQAITGDKEQPDSIAFKAGKVVGDIGSVFAGGASVAGGTGGEIIGVTLDATGVGAVAGVPLNIAAAGAIAYGGTVIVNSGKNLQKDAEDLITHFSKRRGGAYERTTKSDVRSLIKNDPVLVKEAERMGKNQAVQAEANKQLKSF